MAEVCLIHLNEFDKQRLVWDDIFQGHHFLIYAAWHWFLHYDEIPTEEEDSVIDLLLTFIDTLHNGYAYRNRFGLLHDWSKSDHQTIAPLAALSSLGASKAVTALIENAAESHVTDHLLREGLTYASGRGHTAVVRVLLNAGARLNRVGVIDASSLSQALSEAIMRGLTRVAELLINGGATAKGLDYGLISGVAAREGKAHIVKLVHCTITKCEKIKIFYGALQAAMLAKQYSIVECLVGKSAEIEITSKDDRYFATLQMAFFQRDYSTVQYLLMRAFGSEAGDIRRAKIEVLDTCYTPRTKLVLLKILGSGVDPPLLERNHERDYIPAADVYWKSVVEVEYTIRETLFAERKLLEEEDLIEEAMDLLQRIRRLSAAASPTIEAESDDMGETESNDIDETDSDDMVETESDDMVEQGSWMFHDRLASRYRSYIRATRSSIEHMTM